MAGECGAERIGCTVAAIRHADGGRIVDDAGAHLAAGDNLGELILLQGLRGVREADIALYVIDRTTGQTIHSGQRAGYIDGSTCGGGLFQCLAKALGERQRRDASPNFSQDHDCGRPMRPRYAIL